MLDLEQWTKDKNGAAVNWLAPPYYVGGVFRPVLEGEQPEDISADENRKRSAEYIALAGESVRFRSDGTLERVVRDPNRRRYEPSAWPRYFGRAADEDEGGTG